MSENHFAKALHNFTMDAAAGDAIRHLTDKGYTLSQIRETLTFPAPVEYIAKVMWERMLSKGTVLFDNPYETSTPNSDGAGAFGQKLSKRTVPSDTYITETYDRYGRKSFLQVQKKSPGEMIFSPEDYVQYENLWIISSAQEQVFSLSDHIPLKDRSTGSHRDT